MRHRVPSLLLALGLLAAASPVAAEPPAARAPSAAAVPAEPVARRLPGIRLHGDALAGPARTVAVEELDRVTGNALWTIHDPYQQRDKQYQGITLQALVQALAPGAQRVRMRAINDYIVWFDRREWETLPILLATRDEGRRIPVAEKGPARIVYRQTEDNALQMQVHAPKWIWQVIDVEFHAR